MKRYKSTVRYASEVTGVNFEKWLVWGAIGAAVYFVVWPAVKGALALKQGVDMAIDTARDALSSGLYRLFGPEDKTSSTYYTVLFPDGNYKTVPAGAVGSDGVFFNKNLSPLNPGDGKKYRLVIDKRQTTGRNKSAFPV